MPKVKNTKAKDRKRGLMKGRKKERKPSLMDRFLKYMNLDEDDEYLDYDEEEDPEWEDVGPRLYTGGKKSNPNLHLVKGAGVKEKDETLTSEKKRQKGNLRLMNALELEEEKDDEDVWEEDEDRDGDEEKERPWVTALTFLGLAVLAAIICAILWYFTHPEKPESDGQNISSAAEQGGENSGEQPENGENPGSEQAPGEGSYDGQPEGDKTDPGQIAVNGEETADGQGAGAREPEADENPQSGQEEGREPGEQEEPADQNNGISDSEELPDGEVQEPVAGTKEMKFTEQQDSVTPKDVVNLRSVPTTTDEGNIVVQCKNGEVLTRIGVNKDTGWSQIDYNGQTLYAVTQYLTTNLDYKPAVQASNPNRVSTASGRVIIFSNCDDWISPKEYVNLRLEPSTDGGNDTVHCQLNYGEKVHRTGYSADSGWSRVEYDGRILYVVTSLMYAVDSD